MRKQQEFVWTKLKRVAHGAIGMINIGRRACTGQNKKNKNMPALSSLHLRLRQLKDINGNKWSACNQKVFFNLGCVFVFSFASPDGVDNEVAVKVAFPGLS